MASSFDQSPLLPGIKVLPSALIATIMTNLDIRSIQSLASTCKTFRSCAAHILSFIPTFHLFDIAPLMDLLRPLLPSNPYLRSLKSFATTIAPTSCGGYKALHPKICQLAESN
ncbi:unnamed protein product [Fraxinus pennsylvanica]|uniref:F-box domain-containing protein n=1 Tax=Fraxinus pennsylvanica TaxID=56036 RepID=A0AAD2E8M4_9LAMI|nr:unnamed protein product [Fraxinus pennsylvanica]